MNDLAMVQHQFPHGRFDSPHASPRIQLSRNCSKFSRTVATTAT